MLKQLISKRKLRKKHIQLDTPLVVRESCGAMVKGQESYYDNSRSVSCALMSCGSGKNSESQFLRKEAMRRSK